MSTPSGIQLLEKLERIAASHPVPAVRKAAKRDAARLRDEATRKGLLS